MDLLAELKRAANERRERNENNPELRSTVVIDHLMTETIRSRRVTSVVVHVNRSGDQQQSYHWRLFLQTDSDSSILSSSVELNSQQLTAGGSNSVDLTTRLIITPRNYASSTHEVLGTESYQMQESVTVQEVITLLLEMRRDRYRLESDTGSGCRFWCETVLEDFERRDWLERGTKHRVLAFGNRLTAQHPMLMLHNPKGVFY